MSSKLKKTISILLLSGLALVPMLAFGQNDFMNSQELNFGLKDKAGVLATPVQILLLLTILSLLPTILIATTSFLRIIIVLSMLRQAIGMQDTPPNAALISIALFLTIFSMQPVWNKINESAWQPYLDKKVSEKVAYGNAIEPLRDFMIRNTRESDLTLMTELSGDSKPKVIEDINTFTLIPAYMLSELKTAFQIGFMIFLPFLLVDIIVASILTSLGMMMVPPVTISLPLKILMFILIDGWSLVVKSLVSSFH